MRKVLVWVIIVILGGMVLGGLIAYYGSYSDGFRVGHVIKLSHKGMIFKTWEGQLDQGFLSPADLDDPSASSSIATRIWDFSVRDGNDEVRKQIDEAITNGYKVKIYYEEK